MIGDIHIDSIRESSAIGTSGLLEPTVHIVFTVREQGPFTVDIPKASFTADHAQALILTVAQEQINLLDKFNV